MELAFFPARRVEGRMTCSQTKIRSVQSAWLSPSPRKAEDDSSSRLIRERLRLKERASSKEQTNWGKGEAVQREAMMTELCLHVLALQDHRYRSCHVFAPIAHFCRQSMLELWALELQNAEGFAPVEDDSERPFLPFLVSSMQASSSPGRCTARELTIFACCSLPQPLCSWPGAREPWRGTGTCC